MVSSEEMGGWVVRAGIMTQTCELIYLLVKQDTVQGKLSKGEQRTVSQTFTHFIPSWVIFGSLRFIHAFYLPGCSGEARILCPTRSQKSYSQFSTNGHSHIWWVSVSWAGLLAISASFSTKSTLTLCSHCSEQGGDGVRVQQRRHSLCRGGPYLQVAEERPCPPLTPIYLSQLCIPVGKVTHIYSWQSIWNPIII